MKQDLASNSLCGYLCSGCGKSSLLRIIGGLWASDSGSISRPVSIGRGGIFFVPQRPYITVGSLRQQLLYPHTLEEQQELDTQLESIVKLVGLEYLLARFGLDKPADWADILSGGEQQRLGFARLLYHRPVFAVMDEATSALDEALQERCLRACNAAQITMINVAHRSSVIGFHERILSFVAPGIFEVTENECQPGKLMTFPDKVDSLRGQL